MTGHTVRTPRTGHPDGHPISIGVSGVRLPLGSVRKEEKTTSYRVLYADPPWQYEHPISHSRSIEKQYPTMTLEDIRALNVPAADDCALFLWATAPKLAEAVSVVDAWGFDYRTCLVWVKPRLGMGYYFRTHHELLLLALKGNLGTPEPCARPASVLNWPTGPHSAKPEIVYQLIENMYAGPYLELFARPPFRENWDVWGNETYENSEQAFLFTPGNHIGELPA